jgi:hypothetical protein
MITEEFHTLPLIDNFLWHDINLNSLNSERVQVGV